MSRVRLGVRNGLLAGFINVFFVLLGLTGLAGTLVSEWVGTSSQRPGAWLLLIGMGFWAGARALGESDSPAPVEALLGGVVAGLVQGVLLGGTIWLLSALVGAGVDVRNYLAQISSEAMDTLTLGLAPSTGGLLAFVLMLMAGCLGAVAMIISRKQGLAEALGELRDRAAHRIDRSTPVERVRREPRLRQGLYALGILLLLAAPLLLDRYWNYTLGTVGIYIILGLGLNIVVGMAGILNLGYAAFFAIGAYTVAILTAPQFGIMLSFWVALPIGVVLATITGVLLSLPVLRMRGDYLAIVTLGFGEIIRILAKSDILTDFTGGPRGVRAVAGPAILGIKLNGVEHFIYFILIGIVAAIFVTVRLQGSRVGRALKAMREDEDVAQAVGVYTLKYKVMAFAIGAAFAGVGGVLFASRNKFTGPEDFTLLVSVNVLSIVIIGGMNSLPGVVVGALALKGLPEILRQLDDYRMLVFGALLVTMMILRPEGLWPAGRGETLGSEEATDDAMVPRDSRQAEPSVGGVPWQS